MTIQFYHDGTPSVSLAVWRYIVPMRQYDVLSCLTETAGCASTCALTKRSSLNLTAAFYFDDRSVIRRNCSIWSFLLYLERYD